MQPARNILARCVNIHKSFFFTGISEREIHVLKGVDLEIYEGDIVGIVGASGAGKSTLLHILGGLDRPTEGKVFWNRDDISRLDDVSLARLRNAQVGFIFQFHHLLPEFTALENVALAAMIGGVGKKEAERKAFDALTRVGLSDRLYHMPSELSGGEQQRVAVARALLNSPKLVLADEPTGNLDSANAQQIQELVLDLNKNTGQTFVVVTHNEALASRFHRTYRMADGVLQPG